MRQVFAARNVALDVDIDAHSAHVVGDHDRLVQVLINLLGNAAKFSPRSGGQRGAVSSARTGDEFEFAVADNGPGIRRRRPGDRVRPLPTARRRHGRQARRRRARPRHQQRIVAQHGGRIWVDDARGGGAVFKIRLNAARVPEPAE